MADPSAERPALKGATLRVRRKPPGLEPNDAAIDLSNLARSNRGRWGRSVSPRGATALPSGLPRLCRSLETEPGLVTDGMQTEASRSRQAHVTGAFEPSDTFTAAAALHPVSARSECPLGLRPRWQCADAKLFQCLLDPRAWHGGTTVRHLSASYDLSIGRYRTTQSCDGRAAARTSLRAVDVVVLGLV